MNRCLGDGTGRHARLKILFAESECGFDSHLRYDVMIRKNDGTDAKYEMETTEARIKVWI